MSERNATHLHWVDTLRVAAAFGVVVVHVASSIRSGEPARTTLNWWVANVAESSVRWCVPMFVMISGALLLGPSKEESMSTFFKRKMGRILIPLVCWTALYLAPKTLRGYEWTPRGAVDLVLALKSYGHLWFLVMIPGLYLLTPFLRTYLASSSRKEHTYLVVLLLGMSSLHALLSCWYPVGTPTILTVFIPYLGYYICGYHLRNYHPKGIASGTLIGIAGGMILVVAVGTYFLTDHPKVAEADFARTFSLYHYLSLPVIITSIAIFVLGRKAASDVERAPTLFTNVMGHIAPATLGIYVAHPLVLWCLRHVGISTSLCTPIISIPLMTTVVFLLAYILVAVMLRVPFLRRTVS